MPRVNAKPKKLHEMALKPSTVRDLLDCMSDSEWRSTAEIAERREKTARATQALLARVYASNMVERQYRPLTGKGKGGMMVFWRKLQEGAIAPLFDPKHGWDARPLSEAWNGYGYRREASTI